MLSLLSRTARSTVSAARATCFSASQSSRTYTGRTTSKLARRSNNGVDWLMLDRAIASKQKPLDVEKESKASVTSAAEMWANLSDKAVESLGPPLGKYAGACAVPWLLPQFNALS